MEINLQKHEDFLEKLNENYIEEVEKKGKSEVELTKQYISH